MYRIGVSTSATVGAGLAFTGFDAWTWLVLAAAAVVLGGVLLRLATTRGGDA